MRTLGNIIFLSLFLGLVFAESSRAQLNEDYFIANRLFQERKYEQALPRFKRLYENNPGTYLFLERTTDCLINLKRYEEAVSLTREAIERNYFPAQGGIRLGEIYHIQGDTTQAYGLWNKILYQNEGNLQVYLTLARTMRDRRAFERAVGVYQQADSKFSNSLMLSSELAQTYMMAGRYEEAIHEYLDLIEEQPNRITFVRDNLLRFDDEYLYDIAILEIEEFLEELSFSHPGHRNIHDLLVWLLMERNLFERALVTAKNYEQQSSQVTYTLFGLGGRLLSEQEYKLAEEAYRYYIDRNIYPAKNRSLEELAEVYVNWGTYLSRHNLAFSHKRDSLYNEAFSALEKLKTSAPNYPGMNRVLATQSELALDHLHKPGLAQKYMDRMQPQADTASLARKHYITGRIHLYEEEYTRARISFTQSNKLSGTGEMAEKTRYYLALTDFFAGDYEFAKIQLNALERQNTSYFANDALKLRNWIQEGIHADSTGSAITPFARSAELFARGDSKAALSALEPVIGGTAPHPLQDDAILMISSHLQPEIVYSTYSLLQKYLDSWGRSSPLRERLMWEQARIADQVITNSGTFNEVATVMADSATLSNRFFGKQGSSGQVEFPSTVKDVVSLYEEIIIHYPQGFYASFARDRIKQLQQIQT